VGEDGKLARDLEMPVGRKMREYMGHEGYESATKAKSGLDMYGRNSLAIELPSFWVSFKKQVRGVQGLGFGVLGSGFWV